MVVNSCFGLKGLNMWLLKLSCWNWVCWEIFVWVVMARIGRLVIGLDIWLCIILMVLMLFNIGIWIFMSIRLMGFDFRIFRVIWLLLVIFIIIFGYFFFIVCCVIIWFILWFFIISKLKDRFLGILVIIFWGVVGCFV